MQARRRYPNAPITEAIIDIRVELPPGTDVKALEQVQEGLETSYPTKVNRHIASIQGQIGGISAAATASSAHIGYLYTSTDEKRVFQARLDGFTMSRLAPYDRWEPFRNEARRLWDRYRSILKVRRVLRLAVRYVNRIDIPLPIDDLKSYLRTAPEVSSDLPQNLAGYFMQLRIPLSDIHSTLVVNQAVVDSAKPESVSIILDNDLYRTDEVPSTEEDMWDFFEVLRVRKNAVFEACITDSSRELFR